MLFITASINLVGHFWMGYAANIISQRLTRRYRSEIFESVLSQDISFFDRQENTTGAIASRLSTAPTQLQELLGINIAIISITLVNLLSTCITSLVVGWKLALVVMFGALLPIIISAWLRFAMESRLEASIGDRFAASAAIASESVSAIRTVASLTLEDKVVERYVYTTLGIRCFDSCCHSAGIVIVLPTSLRNLVEASFGSTFSSLLHKQSCSQPWR